MNAAPSKREVLKVDRISFSYNQGGDENSGESSAVLHDLSAIVLRGEIVGILGPNGSGKTTFLKTLLRIFRPDSGTMYYFGRPDSQVDTKELAKTMGLVPQRSGGGTSLTVREMVTLGRIPHLADRWSGFSDVDRDAVDRVMASLNIVRFQDRLCGSLSGGEFQKVLLARAIVQESRVLLLDEATSNLDLHHAVEIMDLVREKARSGCAIAAVMHDLNLAAGYCDRVLFLKNGCVRYEGTPAEVYRPEVLSDIFGLDVYLDIDARGVPFVLPRRSRKKEEK